MKDLCNINRCDQGALLVNENLSRSKLKAPPAGEQPGFDVMDDIVCGENVGGGESKRFKWRQVEGRRENKVSAAAKSWHDEERAGGKRQARAN